ncbi:MAG: DEAD/DEAH box helicase [Lachnospiraceae bacterium]|nr:DEAD/DEAH box helicase [Lachnospiraceae bacterium]
MKNIELSKEIKEALEVLKYNEPTEIQKLVIPKALAGRDIVAKSQTGSGKTAAFAIPICEQAVWEENMPGALVLEPTRELTVQVKQEIFQIGRKKRLKVADVFGGFPIEKQLQTLKQKNHIVVGTPGRVLDHMRRGSLKLEKIHTMVIDEADLMFDMGFVEEVSQILNAMPGKIQLMLFSATLNERVESLVAEHMQNPSWIIIEEETETVDTVEQGVVLVTGDNSATKTDDAADKYQLFYRLLISENPDSCMIFCGTREMVNVLCRRLRKDGVKCGMIHGEIDQADRIRTIEDFRSGKLRYLIATDVAARGIDFDHLSHVFNYDFPTGKESYVHRIGRTGRKGELGRALSMVADADLKMRKIVEEYIHMNIPELTVPTLEDLQNNGKVQAFQERQQEKIKLKPKKGAGFDKTITRLSIGGGKKSKMRAGDIVGTICSLEGVTLEDIGIIDVRDSLTYVEILNGKGTQVLDALQEKTIKGKLRKVRKTRMQ